VADAVIHRFRSVFEPKSNLRQEPAFVGGPWLSSVLKAGADEVPKPEERASSGSETESQNIRMAAASARTCGLALTGF
jgi:hypothetical protein